MSSGREYTLKPVSEYAFANRSYCGLVLNTKFNTIEAVLKGNFTGRYWIVENAQYIIDVRNTLNDNGFRLGLLKLLTNRYEELNLENVVTLTGQGLNQTRYIITSTFKVNTFDKALNNFMLINKTNSLDKSSLIPLKNMLMNKTYYLEQVLGEVVEYTLQK